MNDFPNVKDEFEITTDWSIDLDWHKNNLRCLEKFDWTGRKSVMTERASWDHENLKWNIKEVENKVLVANPLFKINDHEWESAPITWPASATFTITKYEILKPNNKLVHVRMKCLSSPGKKQKGLSFRISFETFNTCPIGNLIRHD